MYPSNNYSCRTCRHWDQRFPQNTGLGECLRVSVTMFDAFQGERAAVALSVPTGMRECNPPSREEAFPVLRTVQDFGCVGYEPRA